MCNPVEVLTHRLRTVMLGPIKARGEDIAMINSGSLSGTNRREGACFGGWFS